MSESAGARPVWKRIAVLAASGGVALVGYAAWSRAGLLGLSSVRGDVTAVRAGLADLKRLARLDAFVRGSAIDSELAAAPTAEGLTPAAVRGREGLELVSAGDEIAGLEAMGEAVRLEPDNLVLSNAYRMEVFRLRLRHLRANRAHGVLTPEFPPHLSRQPIAFFEELAHAHPLREVRLSLALAWVEEMLLFPALEIKAPASVEAVDILTDILEGESGEGFYVPALFARGLNHLHRPARLVWPETFEAPADAAARDLGRCVAIGRTLGVGSERLHAVLATALGDAYVKCGRFGVARSWWQIAQNTSADAEIQAAVRRRYGWRDEEILDRLEAELDRARAELDRPMTDLALMWN